MQFDRKKMFERFIMQTLFVCGVINSRPTFFGTLDQAETTSKQYFESQLLKYFANQYQPKQRDVVIDLAARLGEETIVFAGWVATRARCIRLKLLLESRKR